MAGIIRDRGGAERVHVHRVVLGAHCAQCTSLTRRSCRNCNCSIRLQVHHVFRTDVACTGPCWVMEQAIESFFSLASPERGQWCLDRLWECSSITPPQRKRTFEMKLPLLGLCVCPYMWCKWNGVRKSMFRKCQKFVNANRRLYRNPVSAARQRQPFPQVGRATAHDVKGAHDWLVHFLTEVLQHSSPTHGSYVIDRLCIKTIFSNIYLEEAGASAVGLTTFYVIFAGVMKQYNIRYRGKSDHDECKICSRDTEARLKLGATFTSQVQQLDETMENHIRDLEGDRARYIRAITLSRRPNSGVLSICTDKAASANTEVYHACSSDCSSPLPCQLIACVVYLCHAAVPDVSDLVEGSAEGLPAQVLITGRDAAWALIPAVWPHAMAAGNCKLPSDVSACRAQHTADLSLQLGLPASGRWV